MSLKTGNAWLRLGRYAGRDERIAEIAVRRQVGEESSGEGLGVPAGMGLRPFESAQEARGSVSRHRYNALQSFCQIHGEALLREQIAMPAFQKGTFAGHREMAGWETVTFEVDAVPKI